MTKKFGFLYQKLLGCLPRGIVEKIKAWFYVLKTPIIRVPCIHALGSSFKSFFLNNDVKDAINKLKEGLDEQSLKIVDLLIARILNFPETSKQMPFLQIPKTIFTEAELQDGEFWSTDLKRRCLQRWHYDDYYNAATFLYHNGLRNLSSPILNYIKGKDFLDVGAYLGDSVLVFQEYSPRKIISFDISKCNVEKFWKTMQQNRVPKEKVELIIAGVGDVCGKSKINDTGLEDNSICSSGKTEVDLITLDEFTRQRGNAINIGFIKMDVEGFGLLAVKGMAEVLKKYRPVLSLSIYHNPDEFFEIKPLLASLNLNYNFAIRKLFPMSLTADTCLLAWPAELTTYKDAVIK